jgi:hypothetical protein
MKVMNSISPMTFEIIKQEGDFAIVRLPQAEVTSDGYGILNLHFQIVEATRPSYSAALMTLGQALEAQVYAESHYISDAKKYYGSEEDSFGLSGSVAQLTQ